MKRCVTSQIIRKMKIKTRVRHHLTAVRWPSLKSLELRNAREGVEKREPILFVGM